jgi:ribosomal protein S18 acetylase RimI-like enzyme
MEQNKLQHFTIVRSLSDDQINQLITYTHEDPDVLACTRDAQRFTDFETTKEFLKKVDFYALLDGETLCGIIWFHNKLLPDKQYKKTVDKELFTITFGIRLYGNAKGKGLARPFMTEVFAQYKQEKGKEMGIWLETRADNSRAMYVYEKFGFTQVSDPDSDGRIIMIYF